MWYKFEIYSILFFLNTYSHCTGVPPRKCVVFINCFSSSITFGHILILISISPTSLATFDKVIDKQRTTWRQRHLNNWLIDHQKKLLSNWPFQSNMLLPFLSIDYRNSEMWLEKLPTILDQSQKSQNGL